MKDTKNDRKRRNCYHRLRARYIQAKRARRDNPATSAVTQLFAIFAVVIGRAPFLPATSVSPRYSPPQLSPTAAHRTAMARRMGVPVRYLDLVLSQGQVPYAVLFNHIRQGGVLRRDAMIELRKRIPEAALDWLDYVEKWDRWFELLRCHVTKEQEDLTDVRVLKSTVRWLEHLKDNALVQPGTTLETTGSETDPQKPKT